MAKCTICDFCKKPVAEKDGMVVSVNEENYDICDTCFHSSIILSECRRVRLLKPKQRKRRKRDETSAAAGGPEILNAEALTGDRRQ